MKFSVSLFCFCLLLIVSLNVYSTDKNFFEDQPLFYTFYNKNAKLLLNKKTLRVEMQDTERNLHYSEYSEPEFEVDENWISVSGEAVSIKNSSQQTVEFSLSTTSGKKLKLIVEKAGDSGFKLKYNLPEARVSRIRGKIKLNPVEEIYGFGETWNGELAQRGELIEIWDKGGTPDECAWMPYFVSTNSYVFF